MNEHKHPFDIIYQSKSFLSSAGIYSNSWADLLNIYQPPATIKHLAKIFEFEGADCINLPSSIANKQNNKIKLATDYPVFYALKKLNERGWSHNTVKQRVIEIYTETFNLNSRQEEDIDSSIFYTDAYSIRDILLRTEKDNFINLASLSSLSLFRIRLIEHYQAELFKLYDQDTLYKRKLVKFVELISGERESGVRKNKQFEKTASKTDILVVSADRSSEDGTDIQISYPQAESNEQKTLCRVAPKGGSKLTPYDDRLALRGRLNQQSSRSIISVIDMNRLTTHSISEYLEFLWSKDRRL